MHETSKMMVELREISIAQLHRYLADVFARRGDGDAAVPHASDPAQLSELISDFTL